MADPTQKPALDGIRPARSVDGVAGGPVAPVPPAQQPKPAPPRLQRTKVAPAPAAPAVTQQQANPEAAAAPRKKGRLRKVIVFLVSLIIIAAALAGVYWVYINFYA